MMNISAGFLDMLRCPVTGKGLLRGNGVLESRDGDVKYSINSSGIPLFAEKFCTPDARRQQIHYDRIAKKYIENLSYPHTQEYMAYLDNEFISLASGADFGCVAEICCGGGEAFRLLGDSVRCGLGVDVSVAMLDSARSSLEGERYCFIQGDATTLPLADELFSSVFVMGGIHHVNDRYKLFSEIFRVLKPGGKFYWREPVSDFFLWRWIRALIYKASSSLDDKTERPLLYSETVPILDMVGFAVNVWKTYGFLGYCFLMNSDVLVFNRVFRYVPAIRKITRLMAMLDDWIVRLPGLNRSGLIVIGCAEKPQREIS